MNTLTIDIRRAEPRDADQIADVHLEAWKGAYSGITAYAKRDAVRDQGAGWVALQPTTGNAPPTLPATANAFWEMMVAPGVNGAVRIDMLETSYWQSRFLGARRLF